LTGSGELFLAQADLAGYNPHNKSYPDRFQLIGTTIGGRQLKIIFQLKANQVVRIITGWPL
jgi:uncharacterized DUF497 family protein